MTCPLLWAAPFPVPPFLYCASLQARRWVTLVDLLYEASTLHPGSVWLSVSAEVEPQELFRPLLAAAGAPVVGWGRGESGGGTEVEGDLGVALAS